MTFQPTSLALFNSTPWPPATGSVGFYCYATTDTAATVLAAGYFNAVHDKLHVNDIVDVVADADGGAPVLRLKVTAAPLKPGDGDVTVEQIGGSVAPEATTFGVTGGNGHASVGGIAGAGTARIDVYRVPAGATLDRDVHPRLIYPAAPGAWAGIDGDGGVVNALAGAASLGRQWSLPGGKLTHVNTNLDNRAATSADGINYASQTTPTDASLQTWEGIVYSPELNLFCAIASAGGTPTTARAMTSPDGITWTVRTVFTSAFRHICWGGPAGAKLFVAVSATGATNNIGTSPDGITWTPRTKPNSNALRCACWSEELGLFVAVGDSGTGNRVMTSPDGITWLARSSAADNNWQGVCWSAERGLFVAVATSGAASRVMTSPNGIDWTLGTQLADAGQWKRICWSKEVGRFVAVAAGGTLPNPPSRIAWSTDGLAWSYSSTINGSVFTDCIWVAALGRFIACANNGLIRTSPDGDIWTTRPNSPAATPFYGSAWSTALQRLALVANANSINSEISIWNLAALVGQKVRASLNVEAVAGTGVQFALANPDRELLPATPWTTTGVKVTTLLPSKAAAWIGLACPTNGTCTLSAPVAFLETASCAPQGLFDYYAFPFSFSGIEGPAATPVLNVQIV